MTDNISSFTRANPETQSRKPGNRVTIMNGDRWAVVAGEHGLQLRLTQKSVLGTIKSMQAQGALPPFAAERGSAAQRDYLIATLGLAPDVVSRIDANAKLLGLSFATCLGAELSRPEC